MERLPRGRHGLSPEFVAKNQRDRLIAALTRALCEAGYQKTTVSYISRLAGVSKSDFYRHFESKDDCFAVAYEAAVARIREAVREACAKPAPDDRAARLRSGLGALLSLLAGDPPLASIVLVEGLRAGPEIYDRYQAALEEFVELVREVAPPDGDGAEIPAATHEAVVGGIASLLGRRVLAGEAERLDRLFPEVSEFALTPYLGAEEARRIVSSG